MIWVTVTDVQHPQESNFYGYLKFYISFRDLGFCFVYSHAVVILPCKRDSI